MKLELDFYEEERSMNIDEIVDAFVITDKRMLDEGKRRYLKFSETLFKKLKLKK